MKRPGVKDHFSVLIPDGESIFALPVLRCLSQIAGLRTYILSTDAWAPLRFSRYGTRFFSQMRGKGHKERLAAIYDLVKQTKPDVILPVDQQTIRLLSIHGGILSQLTAVAPIPDTVAFDIASNKWLQAEWLTKEDIPCPNTILYQNNKEFEQRLNAMTFPVLIKPTQATGGRGIEMFEYPSVLLGFFKEHVCSEEFIIQSFIRGYDIDCSVLCQEGKILAYTIQKGFMDGYCRFHPPAGIEFLLDNGTHEFVSRLIAKLKWSGIAHIDLRYDEQDKRIKVLEINPRFWGSLSGSLIAGVNFPYLACLAGLGADLPNIEYQPQRIIVGTKAAVSMLIQRLFRRKKPDLDFDSTSIGMTLKDPCPLVFSSCLQGYNKLRRKIQKKPFRRI